MSASSIERLRIKNRISVVQNLEDNITKNVIRSIMAVDFVKANIPEPDVVAFFAIVKEEQMRQTYWGRSSHSPLTDTAATFDSYRMDLEQFKYYFSKREF
jgi:predicted aldo/keto reductase-like oxidoreductase